MNCEHFLNFTAVSLNLCNNNYQSFEPRYEKTGLRGFQPGLTQTGL